MIPAAAAGTTYRWGIPPGPPKEMKLYEEAAVSLMTRIAKRMSSIPNELLHEERRASGFPLGTTKVLWKKFYVAKPATEDGHIAGFGGTGSGKSSCIAQNALESWADPFVATDIDCELSDRYEDLEMPDKRPYKVINLTRRIGTFPSYDPLHIIRAQQGDIFEEVIDLVNCLIPLPYSESEPFWKEAGRDLLTGFIIYYIDEGYDFNTVMKFVHDIPHQDIIAGISSSNNDLAKAMVSQFLNVDSEDLANNKMFLSLSTTIKKHVRLFATNPVICAAFAPSEEVVTWADLDIHNIFISIDHDRLEQYGGAVRLIATQLARELERRPRKHTPSAHRMKPLLLMLDEFPAYGKLDIITGALATLRKKDVTIALFAQSLSQFDMIYGEHERKVILDNLSYLAILRVSEPDSQRYLAERIGYRKVAKVTNSESFNGKTKEKTNYSTSISHQWEYIIRPSELGKLKDDFVLVAPEGVYWAKKDPYYAEKKDNEKGFFSRIARTIKDIVAKIKSFMQKFFGSS